MRVAAMQKHFKKKSSFLWRGQGNMALQSSIWIIHKVFWSNMLWITETKMDLCVHNTKHHLRWKQKPKPGYRHKHCISYQLSARWWRCNDLFWCHRVKGNLAVIELTTNLFYLRKCSRVKCETICIKAIPATPAKHPQQKEWKRKECMLHQNVQSPDWNTGMVQLLCTNVILWKRISPNSFMPMWGTNNRIHK